MKDYYEILEVSRKASKDTINKVFKMHMKANHPDLFQGQEKVKAEEKSKEFTEAYNILSDDNARAKYDAELKENEQVGGNASMLQTIQEENEYLKQVIAQKNDFIARLTGSYTSQSNTSDDYYDNGYGQATYGHKAHDPYAGMTYEQIQQLQKKERLEYFIARLKNLGSQFFILFVLGIILIISLFSSLKNLSSIFGGN